MNLSRRRMMKMSAGALIAANLWPGRLHAADVETKPLKFAATNDLHYFDDKCNPFFEGLVKKYNEIDNLDFVIFAGDLVEGGTLERCKALHSILSKIKVPYFISCGNHDPATATDRKPFLDTFGDKLNFSKEINGWQLVGLDTSEAKKSSGVNASKETLEFAGTLPKTLDKNRPTFVYTHFPVGPGVTNRLANADTLLDPMKELNIAAIFTGHHHAFTKKDVLKQTIATTNTCCSFKRANHDGRFQKGFLLIDAADGKYTRTYTEYGTDFPGAATANNRPLPATPPAAPEDKSAPWY